ncbi:hypothetical protein N7530_010375 [Penicillium desertorum]|uniref:Amino acid transporter transmembrane domain-containing protein n=1 Tax=Penicillium desertorum TaxID=1303715 RepID=A0A9X0BHJ6_9EURO|nr:hypothetical protein N7530_010375 [Penicillium desertorum]
MTAATDIENDVGQKSSDLITEEENSKPTMPSNEAEDPFGNEEHGQIKYRVMSWWCNSLTETVMIAQNISLGILSLPSAVATLGIAPAIIILLGLSAISWYTAFVIGQFKLRYPQIHSMADAGELLMGRIGRELLGTGQLLLLIFSMASHILTSSVLMNTLTNHGTCTIVFAVVGTLVSFVGALPRTMDKVYWISVASFASILAATVVTMVAIGVQATGPDLTEATIEVSFQKAFLAVTNIVFAYIVHVAFFGYMSEMDEPRDFPKSLALLQVVDTCMYVVTAVVIYRYAGPDVASPALSSAGPIMKNFASIGAWVAIGAILWAIAFVIAESIPVFNDLLSLILPSSTTDIDCFRVLFSEAGLAVSVVQKNCQRRTGDRRRADEYNRRATCCLLVYDEQETAVFYPQENLTHCPKLLYLRHSLRDHDVYWDFGLLVSPYPTGARAPPGLVQTMRTELLLVA